MIGALSLGAAGLAAATALLQLRLMLTDSSAPAGIYQLIGSRTAVRGALVMACLPEAIARAGRARGYLSGGACPGGAEPVAKVIGAIDGDLVELTPEAVSVNGVALPQSRTAARDSHNRPLAHAPWAAYHVGPGEAWLFGFHDTRSWDARYFGPVPARAVQGELRPLLTW